MCYKYVLCESIFSKCSYTAGALFFNFGCMETTAMLEKILKREELSPAEQVEILRLVRAEHIDANGLNNLLKKDFLSIEQKIELLGKLVNERAQKILLEEYLIASMGISEKVDITLRGEDFVWSKNLEKFLRILGAKNIETKANVPGWDDHYDSSIRVMFRV